MWRPTTQGSSSTLFGRDREVALLAERLAQARGGGCQVVLLAGEPGIGKSRLLDALAVEATRDGVPVLRGGAAAAAGLPPYLPLLEALRQHIRTTPAGPLRAQLGAFAPVLLPVLPELAAVAEPSAALYALPPDQARLRLYEAVGAALGAIAAPHGLALLLDDLQWADRATLELLGAVVRQQANARLLIVGTYRPGEAEQNAALQRALVELTRLRVLTTLAVGPLAPAAIDALAQATLGAPLAPGAGQLLWAQSEGTPFIAEELLHDWRETGALVQAGGSWRRATSGPAPLPATLRSALHQRLARLTPELHALLSRAALLGRAFEVALLAGLAGRDAEAVEEQLLLAVRLRLLTATPDGGFAFSHDTIRAYLAERVPATQRRRLHGRIGQLLEARAATLDGRRLAELAFHVARSGDTRRGITYAWQAGDAAMQVWAFAEAAAHYRGALELLEPDDARRGPLLHSLGEAALLANAHPEAVDAFASAQSCFLARGDAAAAARAAEGEGRAWWRQEAIPQARACFELALTLLGERATPERVGVLISLSGLLTLSLLQRDAGLDYARQALALAQGLDEPRAIIAASRALGNAEVRAGRLAPGIALLEQARALAVTGDAPAEAAECCAGLRIACCWSAEYRRAIAYAHQEIALAGRCHAPYAVRHVYTQLVVLATVTDGAAAGEAMLATARAVCAGLAAPEARAYLALTEGMFWGLLRGDYARGEPLAGAAITTWRALNPPALVWYLGVYAMLLARAGRREAAAACRDELEALIAGLPADSMAAGQAWSWVAAVSLTLGERERLPLLAARLAPFRGCLMTGGLIDRLLGEVALAQGELVAAGRALDVAEGLARREGHHWELAQVLAARANLLLALGGEGSAGAARELLRAAQAHYRHVGNEPEAAALDLALRRLGEPLPLPAGLSRREAEVLRAVAAGKSNRVIAAELVLSRRTVENHLANIYAKIGADNRAAAVAFAIGHGLA